MSDARDRRYAVRRSRTDRALSPDARSAAVAVTTDWRRRTQFVRARPATGLGSACWRWAAGPPVLLVHGTIGPGSWAVAGWPVMAGDSPKPRPGSSRVGTPARPVEFPRGRLYRALRLPTCCVRSLDKTRHRPHRVWSAVRSAMSGRSAWPSTIPIASDGSVLLGGGPIVSEVGVPGVVRALASPIGALMVRLPLKKHRLRSMLRESGHSASLEDGRVADEFIKWRMAAATDTVSMRHERKWSAASSADQAGGRASCSKTTRLRPDRVRLTLLHALRDGGLRPAVSTSGDA